MGSPLLADSLDADRRRALEDIRDETVRIWARPLHRYYTDHTVDHSDRVIALLDGLAAGVMRTGRRLSPGEVFVLLAAAYLHDIGMQNEHFAGGDLEEIRAGHDGYTAEMIYAVTEDPAHAFTIPLGRDPGLAEAVAHVAKGHRCAIDGAEYDPLRSGGETIRLRLLAALLRLGDALDIDYRRVDLEAMEKLTKPPLLSRVHWWKCHYVSGVSTEDELVRIEYRFPETRPDYESLIPPLVEGEIRAEFAALQEILWADGVKVALGDSRVRAMRLVQPMPPEVWVAAQGRLAEIRGVEPAPASLVAETVRGLLATMGYVCDPPLCGGPLTCFRCRPQGGGLGAPLVVGCKDGPAEPGDVQAVANLAGEACAQGYLIAEARVLPSAEAAAQAGGRVRVFTLSGFYNELLPFRDYVARLAEEYETSELAAYYQPLGCVRLSYDDRGEVIGQDRYKPMDDYVDLWLRERAAVGGERNHISVLGDYGTGKTSFCRQYAARQGRRWLADPDRERIPVLINLREYTKTLKLESLITDALVNQYGIRGATYEAFERFNNDGKLLLLFDGFDEMALRTGLRTAVENFWELAKAAVPGSKVILTCRTPYFPTHHHAEALLHGRRWEGAEAGQPPAAPDEAYIDLRDRPNFEIVYLEPFTDDDIQAVLRARYPAAWQGYWERIRRIYDLPELARRPVLLDMIVKTLAELKEGETVNAARLYRVYTGFWVEREVAKGRTLITPDDRRLFAEELAMEMLRGGELAVHYSQIPARVTAYFRLDKAEDIDHFEADIRTCNFMVRDDRGHYAFAHKSFLEFFAASRLHRLMLEYRATQDGPVRINEEIRRFLTDLFALEPKREPGPPCPPPEGFAWVPPGEFVLGGRDGLELQIARLERGFFAGRTPVTNAQYARFVAATRRKAPKHWKGQSPPDKTADHPMVEVTWHDAAAYAQWAGARLPTEEEWEKAARGCDGREYPWGEWALGRCNSSEAGIGGTSPVGRYSPAGDSPYGLQDVSGNVWEWTASAWRSGDDSPRVLRGGSFDNSHRYVRCACRDSYDPHSRLDFSGFRVVLAAPIFPPSAL